eukprot:7862-Heterococcus_DN1.PRE.2
MTWLSAWRQYALSPSADANCCYCCCDAVIYSKQKHAISQQRNLIDVDQHASGVSEASSIDTTIALSYSGCTAITPI